MQNYYDEGKDYETISITYMETAWKLMETNLIN